METLRFVLCSEPAWSWDMMGGNTIIFNEDNTGELQCRIELNAFIGAEFEWESSEPLDQLIDVSKKYDQTPYLLKQFKVEVTLTKRRTARFLSESMQNYRINESCLTDDAFEPKTYIVRLEKGDFITPSHARAQITNGFTQRFALRLLFDKSPYPPRHEWRKPSGGPDANQFWDYREFAGHELPELEDET